MEFLDFIKEWLTPTGLVVIIGFIVWLVQHNILLIQQQKALGLHSKAIKDIEDEHEIVAKALERIVARLEYMDEKHSTLSKEVHEHNEKAENWKQRIVAIETALKIKKIQEYD